MPSFDEGSPLVFKMPCPFQSLGLQAPLEVLQPSGLHICETPSSPAHSLGAMLLVCVHILS